MKIEKLFALAFVAMFVVIGTIVPSSAAKFSAEKYFKQPAAAMAIVIAVQSLSGCEEEVTFSEEAKTEEGAKYLIVSVTCPKVETEPGKFGTQTTKVTFEDIEGRLDVTDFSYE